MELLEVFYNPGAAFAKLRGRKWAWVVPALIMIAIGIATMATILGKFSAIEIIEQQMQASGQEMPPQGVGGAAGFITAFMYISVVFWTPVSILLLGLLLLAIVKGFSGETTFPNMLNAATFAMFPWSVASTILVLLMLMTAPDLATFNLENPVPLNAGFFVSADDVGKPVVALLSGINLLNFYFIYLLAVGASKLADRVTMGKVLGPIIAIYFVFVLGKAGLAAIF